MSTPTDYQPERRPITSRDRAISKRISRWLVKRQVTPNAISVAGMVAGVAAGVAFAVTTIDNWAMVGFVAAAVLMQLRLLANMFDGMVAIESDSASPVGELYNEVPDRVSDMAMFIGAGYALDSSPTLGYLAACLAVFVAYLRAEGKVAGAPQQFCGPLAKPQRVFLMTLSALFCAVLPAEILLRLNPIESVWVPAGLMSWILLICIIGMIVTSVHRLHRIANHLQKEKK